MSQSVKRRVERGSADGRDYHSGTQSRAELTACPRHLNRLGDVFEICIYLLRL